MKLVKQTTIFELYEIDEDTGVLTHKPEATKSHSELITAGDMPQVAVKMMSAAYPELRQDSYAKLMKDLQDAKDTIQRHHEAGYERKY